MNMFVRSAARTLFIVGAVLATALVSSPFAYAAQEEQVRELSREVGIPLIAGQEAYNVFSQTRDPDAIATALEKFAEADAVEEKTPWENYQVQKMFALAYVAQQDLVGALAYLNRALDTGQAPEEDKQALLKTAMLLNYNAKDYDKTIAYGTQAQSYPSWDAQADLVMTTAYYFKDDYAGAEQYALAVIARGQAAGQPAAAELLSILYNAQIQQDKTAAARHTIEQLAIVDPTPEHWSSVIDSAFSTPGLSDRQYLNLYRLRVRAARMEAADYTGMAELSMAQGLPREAQSVVQKGIDTGGLSAADLTAAIAEIEDAVGTDQEVLADFEAEAVASASGEIDVRLGETLWTHGRAADAEAAIRRGLEKGGVQDVADAQVVLGIVLLEQGKKEEALQMFQQAERSPSSQEAAHVWGVYASI